jgi:hydrogenase maturation protease
MSPADRTVLIVGYGNPGRLDDGLGPALAEAVEGIGLPGVSVDADYQLNVEHAALVAEHDVVLLADADVAGPEPFWIKRLEPGPMHVGFSSHSVEPQSLLGLAHELFGAQPEAYVMGIRGYEFNQFGESLSPKATENLAAAMTYIEAAVRSGKFQEVRPEGADQPTRSPATPD